MALDIERRIGNEILRKIRSLQLPLELDEITEGRGNCFPLAILAQCRRPGIYQNLDGSLKFLAYKNDPSGLRQQVQRFMVSSNHPRVQEYKRRYEEVISVIDKINWREYWELMTRNYEWADYIFIQSTAWFLGHDIIIITTTSTDSNPYITISGNLTNENHACSGLPLILGSKSQVHFQSLLPLRGTVQKEELRTGSPKDSIKMKISVISNSAQKGDFMKGIKSENSETFAEGQFDLSSLDDFPDLQPNKASKQLQPKNLKIQINEQKIIMVESQKEASTSEEKQNKKEQNYEHQRKQSSCKQDQTPTSKNYTLKFGNKIFYFETDKRVKCPECRHTFKNILNHIKKSKCSFPDLDNLTVKIEEFIKTNMREEQKKKQREKTAKSRLKQREKDNQKVKDDQNRWKCKSDSKFREEDNQKVKDAQNKRKCKSNNKLREEDYQKVKDGQNKMKCKSDSKLREEDNQKVKDAQNKRKRNSDGKLRKEDDQKVKDDQNKRKFDSDSKKRNKDDKKVKEDQNKRKRLSRNKRKLERPVELSKYENEMQKKKRRLWNASDRLREFKEATKYNAIFICSCCHRRLFYSNVEVITDKLKSSINDKKPGHFRECIEKDIETPINGQNDCYVCKTCINHMKAKKLPPMAVKNNLELEKQDESLQLTELEGSLIAKNIIFQKIFQLPKSRWTALTDKIINVPITHEDINNTVKLLPRTPREAGLIGVAFKRKLEYKNTHKHQLVNPDKILRMLDLLRKSGNPYYQIHDDYDAYQERCKEDDPEGYEVVFQSDDDIEEDLEILPKHSKEKVIDEIALKQQFSIFDSDDDLDSDDDEELKDEVEYITKDPVRKYQFSYNKSVCMANKYPEIEARDPTREIEVAPGEGKVPSDIMRETDWDIKAFPHLHNSDGSNGKDQKRRVRLTDQNYFIQRILNKDQRFARSPAYNYAAVAYLEKMQLQRNINLSGTRGKRVENSEGGITYELEDGYTVLDDIKNTPRYWKKAKYEMLAKLDNIGAFQFFFTLSCADMRWQENFAAILRDEGLHLTYKVIKDEEGHYNTKIEVEFQKEGKTIKKDIQQYLEDEAQSSLHEMIRGNVLLATRYFNDRVKKFMDLVVMGDNNPMMVEYFTYKVEFQERGAGHIHGTLWLKLDKIERLIRNDKNELEMSNEVLEEQEERQKGRGEDRSNKERPFKGICSAFKKLKNMEELSESEKEALKNFIDEFTTVCTNEQVVGKRVSKMVLEVNIHHHTKSCRKYGCPCRFFYPRFPSVRTIIAEPIRGMDSDKKKQKLKQYETILNKVEAILMDSEVVEEIIKLVGDSVKEPLEVYKVNKVRRIEALLERAKVSLKEYEEALSFTNEGYKVVIERDLTEIFVNSYNVEWMEAWNGNMDMQPCFDFHATITYITDYFGKDDTGLMQVINAALQGDTKESTKERMKTVANTFLTHRQIGEAEAVYRLIPNMLLKNSNIACQWLSVGKKADISKRWKLATKVEVESRQGLVKIKDHEGLWYQQQDMLSKFLRRSGKIELICPVQFAKMLTTSGLNSSKIEQNDEAEDDGGVDTDGAQESEQCPYDTKQKFHYIITENDDTVPIPKWIEINDPYPGEPKWMRKRKGPAVIRYHKSNKDKQYENWMLKELMLYTPYRETDLEEYEKNTAEVYIKKESWIKSVKSKVMEHLESVEEARYMVEQSTKEVDMEAIGINMDSELEQVKLECLIEGMNEHPDYLYLDTDGVEQLNNKQQKSSIFKEIEVPDIKELREQTRKLDKFQREVLNISIKYAKDIVKARRYGNSPPIPIYLMAHGGAGAGKSTVIHIVSKWCQQILSKEGDEIGCPHILKTAFTGTAASNIDGQTLHTSFGFTFENKHYALSDKTRDEKRAVFKNLKMVIIDEVSMVKSDMLYQLDLKLQELKERVGVPFGGIAILAFGDLLQLRPVMGAFIFEKPKNPEFHATFRMDNRWEKFKTINLEVNHRQGEDKVYAEILNRIRVGKMKDEDTTELKKRVRSKSHADIKEAGLYIVATRETSAKHNNGYLNSLPGEEYQLKARHYHPTQKKFKPFIDKKEGTIGTTAFLDVLRLKIGAKIIIIHNIDVSDGLTNGQLGVLVAIINSKDGEADKLIVKPQKKSAGIQNRRKFPGLAMRYPDSVVIERTSCNHSIRKRGGAVGSTATLVQFPVKMAQAITSHKIQGQTISKPMKVAFDINSCFEEAQGYVMLSRVQELGQVYILNKFDPKKVYPSKKALVEVERMNKVSYNENPGPWGKADDDTLKIVSLNCAGLSAHHEDIQSDDRLKKANIIHLVEISLAEETDENAFSLEGYQASFIKKGNGKGTATYFDNDKIEPAGQVKMDNYQIMKFKHKNMDLINIYRSQTGNSAELLEQLKKKIDDRRITLITGDFNACFLENLNNRLIQGLLGMGFNQLVQEATHIRGRHIDQAYFLDPTGKLSPIIERYSPYYSDHDGICIIIPKLIQNNKKYEMERKPQ